LPLNGRENDSCAERQRKKDRQCSLCCAKCRHQQVGVVLGYPKDQHGEHEHDCDEQTNSGSHISNLAANKINVNASALLVNTRHDSVMPT
jgi:hypothetical protein